MLFSNKTKKLRTITSTFISMSQIASYVIRLKEEHGFETLAIKIINSQKRCESRCEFHDIGNDENLREFFKYKTKNQIEDEIYATPFYPFKSETDDGGFSIINKLDNSERRENNGILRSAKEKAY